MLKSGSEFRLMWQQLTSDFFFQDLDGMHFFFIDLYDN